MLLFSNHISERLTYTLDFVFHERDLTYELTNDWYRFENETGAKLNYSNHNDSRFLQLIPSTLLFDEAYFQHEIEGDEFESEFCFQFDRILDPLASIFYVLSRFEEYTNKGLDFHDRFQAKSSILFKYNLLDKAMCDRWAVAFLTFLSKNTDFQFAPKIEFPRIIPSFDIDNARAFEWKAVWRRIPAQLRDYLKRDTKRIVMRKKVRKGEKDPYDTFAKIQEIALKYQETKVFWLLGDYGTYDKNVHADHIKQILLIQKMAKLLELGLHPSYQSNESYPNLRKEKGRLEAILNHEVTHSRQHFLKLSFPKTYQNLISLGFEHDYTMGFADQVGFRAGTARPHYFFDLSSNHKTNLLIHPFVYMDGTLNEYLKLSISESKKIVKKLYEEVHQYGGDFMFIWHNETIGDFGKWKSWSEVLDFTLSLKNT